MTYATLGSISSGTMLAEDLIPTFAGELETLCKAAGKDADPDHVKLYKEANEIEDHEYESDEAQDILNELFDALNTYAPPYSYFGSHPGDGADYGFWLYENFQRMMVEDDVLQVNDTSEVPADYSGEVLHVNDHGNVTFYTADKGALSEVWSIV